MGNGNMICSLTSMTMVLEVNVSLFISSSKLPHRTRIVNYVGYVIQCKNELKVSLFCTIYQNLDCHRLGLLYVHRISKFVSSQFCKSLWVQIVMLDFRS
jgi:hypothetical protein